MRFSGFARAKRLETMTTALEKLKRYDEGGERRKRANHCSAARNICRGQLVRCFAKLKPGEWDVKAH